METNLDQRAPDDSLGLGLAIQAELHLRVAEGDFCPVAQIFEASGCGHPEEAFEHQLVGTFLGGSGGRDVLCLHVHLSFVVAVVRVLAGLSQLPAQGKAGATLRPTRTDEQRPAPDSPVTPVTRLIFTSGSTDCLVFHHQTACRVGLRPDLLIGGKHRISPR